MFTRNFGSGFKICELIVIVSIHFISVYFRDGGMSENLKGSPPRVEMW